MIHQRFLLWIERAAQIALGVTGAVILLGWSYSHLNDPLTLERVYGDSLSPTTVRLYFTGIKHHDRCPGHWDVFIQGHKGSWVADPIVTIARQRAGRAAPGRMENFPVDVTLPEPLMPGRYIATVVIEYQCLMAFRHRASFELVVP